MPSFSPLQKYKSPHFDSVSIPVEFLVIHYTAQSLKESLKIFLSKNRRSSPVSCHLLIDRRGKVFELVSCWNGVCHRAFHAGKSQWTEGKKTFQSFNDFSIGVELVNLNGNFYPYTNSQYQSLFQTLFHLKKIYPTLQNPQRILGHEHIAGFRGKADPGIQFQWRRLFHEVYKITPPKRPSLFSEKQIESLSPFFKKSLSDEKAKEVSLILESSVPFAIKKRRLKLLMNS